MQIKFVDNQGYFGEGYYDAEITKIEPYKTRYGQKLLACYKIKNEHDREMLINDFIPAYCTADNLYAKIYSLACPGKNLRSSETSDMIGKHIGIVLVKKIKKGRSYLNVSNYLPLKGDKKVQGKTTVGMTPSVAEQLATILQADPALAAAVAKQYNLITIGNKKAHARKDPKKMDSIIEDLKPEI